MKKHILVFTALLMALFFTACEQDAPITPTEDTVQIQNIELSELPVEAAQGLQAILDGNLPEFGAEERCNTYSSATGSVQEGGDFVWASKFCTLGVEIEGQTNTGQGTYFYAGVYQKHINGSYYNIMPYGNLTYGSGAGWVRPFSLDINVPSDYNWECDYLVYIFIWDGPCNTWKVLAYNQFN